MERKKYIKLVGHVLVGTLLTGITFIAASVNAASEAPNSIKVGAAMPISGRFASGGHTVKLGYEIAVDFINKSGGVYVKEFGKKVPLKLIILDDESDPVKTVSKMETLNETNGVVAYLGGFGSSLHAAAAGVAEKNRIPYLGVAFTLYSIHQQGYKYLFSPYPKTPNSIKTLFEMLDTLPPKERPTKMAIFRLTTDWGIEQAEAIHKMAPPGYEVVMDMKYRPLTKDFSAMILKAKAAGADSLWSNPIPPDGIALIRQCKELNWNPKFLYVVRASTYANWIKALGPAGNYAVCDSPYHWSCPFKGNKAFVEEFKKRDKVLPDTTAGAGYVCVQILANAIERCGILNREKLRDAIADTDMVTIMGPIRFEADGTPKMYGPDGKILAIGGMSQWIEAKQELVWPPNLATSSFAYPAKPFKER
ncbi:MAG: amino acid ABC transporter substrate-binding protein [Desulfobacteraceae bacterium]|nr:amino acid ABC transporter substrate-binding protein [Desulfobacteraceae bacterium]